MPIVRLLLLLCWYIALWGGVVYAFSEFGLGRGFLSLCAAFIINVAVSRVVLKRLKSTKEKTASFETQA